MTSIIHSRTGLVNASIENVWNLYVDVKTWSEWDPDLTSVAMIDTHFEDGSKISLKMKDGKEYVAVLSQVVEQQSFTFSVKVPGAELVTSHLLDKSVDGQQTTITHSCGFSGGFIKSFWGILFKKKIVHGVDECVSNIQKRMADDNSTLSDQVDAS